MVDNSYDLSQDDRFMQYVINRMVPIPKIMEQIDMRGHYEGNIYCP